MARSSHVSVAFLLVLSCMPAAFSVAQELLEDELPPPSYPASPPDASPIPPPTPLPPRPLGEDPDKFQLALEVMWDGMVTARDPQTQEVRWSFSSGYPLSSAHGLLLDALEGTNLAIGIPGETPISEDEFVFCSTDWRLYTFDKKLGIEVLPIPPDELVRKTPTVLNGAIILGTATTSVFVVDAKSGTLVRTFDSRNESFSADPVAEEDLWHFLELTFDERKNADYLFVLRRDYSIKSVSIASGALLWNVSVADVQLQHMNSTGILRLPGDGEESLKGIKSPQPVTSPVALPAGDEGHAQFFPDVMQDEFSLDEMQHSIALQSPLRLSPIKTKILGAFLTLGCIFATILIWKNILVKQSEEGRQVARRRRPRKARAGTVVTPQEPAQANNIMRQGPAQENNLTPQEPAQATYATPQEPAKAHISSTQEDIVGAHAPLNPVPSNEPTSEETTIGLLRVLTTKHIGFGSNGTMVFEGFLGSRPVAVKRMLTQYYDKAQKEISHLIKSDAHPNILRYHLIEYDAHFVYVALERCHFSLNDLILAQSVRRARNNGTDFIPDGLSKEDISAILQKTRDAEGLQLWDDFNYPSTIFLKLLRDILEGLAHLHKMGIVHRDLKPHNVLITCGDVPRAKLSDMGISKQLADGVTTLESQCTGAGSSGWQAPEQLTRTPPLTKSMDLFSLGCILYFCISGGYHPFGSRLERDHNIAYNKPCNFFYVEHVPEAGDLIGSLLKHTPSERPRIRTVKIHPLFWSSEKRLRFLCEASDRVELEEKQSQSPILKDIEDDKDPAFIISWASELEPVFVKDFGKHRKYKYNSVRDLLRLIRNKFSHYLELPEDVRALFDPEPDGFELYFRRKYPKLLLNVFKVMRKHCQKEEWFKKHFADESTLNEKSRVRTNSVV